MNTNNQKNGTKAKRGGEPWPGASEDQHSLLKEFFIDELKDLFWAEKHLTKVLPKMAKAATTEELKEAFQGHLKETEGHVSRLEQVFQLLGEKAKAKKCEAIEGITREG
jgi:ferritin-like metal-binding protein YciE